MALAFLALATAFAVAAPRALAAEPTMIYSGRLMVANGKPLSGTHDVELRFYGSATGTDQVGPAFAFTELAFADGIFQAPLVISGPDQDVIFGDHSTPLFIETKVGGKTYPRQRFSATPYALRIPIDDKTLRYDDSTGRLTVGPSASPSAGQFLTKDGSGNFVWATPSGAASAISGKPINATTPTSGQLLQYDGTEWKATTFSLGYTPLNKAGDVMSGALGLASLASDPTGLAAGDKGKVWFNTTSGEVKYWNGSAAVALGAAGSGLSNLSGEIGTTQTLSVGSAGNAPAWTHSSNDHKLDIPMANAGASVTAGLISNTDYAAFNGKVNKAGDAMTGNLTTTGSIGIGTTAPLTQLHVANGAPGADATYHGNLILESKQTLNATNGLEFKASNGGNGYGYRLATVYDGAADIDLLFQYRSNNANWTSSPLIIRGSNGNVGVGTTVPGVKLDVAGTVAATGFKLSTAPTNGYVLTSDGSGNGTWQAAPGTTGLLLARSVRPRLRPAHSPD